jgi:hypothetical protein
MSMMGEAQGQIGNPQGEHLPLEAITRGLVKMQLTEKTALATVKYRLYRSMNCYC